MGLKHYFNLLQNTRFSHARQVALSCLHTWFPNISNTLPIIYLQRFPYTSPTFSQHSVNIFPTCLQHVANMFPLVHTAPYMLLAAIDIQRNYHNSFQGIKGSRPVHPNICQPIPRQKPRGSSWSAIELKRMKRNGRPRSTRPHRTAGGGGSCPESTFIGGGGLAA